MPTPRLLPPLVAAACALGLAACSAFRLERALAPDAADWPTLGGGPERTGCAAEAVAPPLRRDWEYDFSAGAGGGSPVAVDSTVLIATLRGELHALNAHTGKRLGVLSVGDAIAGSPAVDRTHLFLAASNTAESVSSYDFINAAFRWRRNCGDVEASPLLMDRRVVVGSTQGVVSCLEQATGDLLWSFALPGNTTLKGVRSSPAGADGVVIFGADDGALYALGASDGRLRWRVATGSPVTAPPAIASGTAYAGTTGGTVYAVAVGSGAVRWTYRSDGPIHGHCVAGRGMVFAGTLGGTVAALDTATGSPAWTRGLDAPITAGGLLAGSHIYFGTLNKQLVALQADDGALVWRTDLPGRVKSPPAAAHGRIFVATDERLLLAFRSAAP